MESSKSNPVFLRGTNPEWKGEWYRHLGEISFDGIVVHCEGKVVYINRAGKKIIGARSQKEILGRSVLDFVHPDYGEIVKNRIRRALEQHKASPPIEERLIRLDGGEAAVEVTGMPVVYRGKKAVLALLRDISQKKRAEEVLKESEEKYRRIVELSPDAIVLLNLKGVVTDCNSSLSRLTGISKDEMVGKHFSKLAYLFKKDIPKYVKIFSSLLKGKNLAPFEVKWKHKNGQVRDGEIFVSLISKDGRIRGVQVIARDITDRKLAYDQLKFQSEFERLIIATSTRFINISPHKIDEAINETLEEIGKFSGVDRSYIFLFSEDGRTMDNTHEWCLKGIKSHRRRLQGISADSFFWGLRRLRNGKILHLPRVNDLPPEAQPEKEEFERKDARSVLCVPILRNEKSIGFIGFDSARREKTWTEESILLLRLVGDVLSNAIDRLRKERELHHSEEKFRSLAENSPSMIFINQNGRVVYANKECERTMGYTREEFLFPGFNFFSLIAPESHEKVKLNYDKHQRGEDVAPSEYTLKTKNGARIEVIISSKLIIFEGGTAILGIVTNITSRKRDEITKTAIYRISERAREADNLYDLYREIHRSIADVMPAEKNFYIALHDEIRNTIDFPYFKDEYEDNPGPQKLSRGLTEYVLRTGRPLLVTPEIFEGLAKRGDVVSVGPPSVDWLGVPLLVKNKTIGVMVVQSYSEGIRFTEADKELLVILSEQAARVIERKRNEREILDSRERLRNLTAHLQAIREQERTNIAREIHDEMGQTLTALKMDLAWIKGRMDRQSAAVEKKMGEMSALLDGAVQSVKRISTELRPGLLDDFGLSAAMEWQVEEFKNRTGIDCRIKIEPEEIVLDRNRTTAMYRIFQEALTNVARHAGAKKAAITLVQKGTYLELRVTDDGRGITEEQLLNPESYGIMGMRERTEHMKGEIVIRGKKDKGSLLKVRIPIKPDNEETSGPEGV